jgi:hypothetical protein
MRKPDAARTLLRLGADPDAFESQQYDIATITAVARAHRETRFQRDDKNA